MSVETTIHTILEQFRKDDLHNRHLGDRFERLMCRYLELDPMFADRFSNVWMWNEWPRKGATGDIGIDIVAEERSTGEFCAIQCKFYQPHHTLSKEDIDSFFNALGDKRFTSGLIVSTTDLWGSNAEKSLLNRDKPVGRLRVQDLDESPIDWSRFSLNNLAALRLREKKGLRPHQVKARVKVREGFQYADRGKLIMACGTGKTLTALRIAEEQAPAGHVLFLVPSLSLLSQSLREWTAEADKPIHALAVCSDVNIGKHSNREKPGEHFTPREVIRLMVDLVLVFDTDLASGEGAARTVNDCCCGTGGMLTITKDRIQQINPQAKVFLYGQELNPQTWAISRSDMLILEPEGKDTENIKLGSTLGTSRKLLSFGIMNEAKIQEVAA